MAEFIIEEGQQVAETETLVRFISSPSHFTNETLDYSKAFSDNHNDCSLQILDRQSKEECISKGQEYVRQKNDREKKKIEHELSAFFLFCKPDMERLSFSTSEDPVTYCFKIKRDNPINNPTHAILCLVEEKTNVKVESPLKRESFLPVYKEILEQLAIVIEEGIVGNAHVVDSFYITEYKILLQPCLVNKIQ